MGINSGIIIVDKGSGITSFKIVAFLRRMLNIKKVGHMGTLDPMATGVLPVMLGSATKALSLVPSHDKGYIAGMKFGMLSDTQDMTGTILKTSDKKVTKKDLEEVIPEFIGNIYQVPPMYSAIKKNGVRLYDLARAGKTVEREKRSVNIHAIDLLEFDENSQTAKIHVKCSGGTYIRTLCSDIGDTLGCFATMTSLRRTMSNGFTLDDSLTIDEIKKHHEDGTLLDKIFKVDCLFENFPRLDVDSSQAMRLKNGAAVTLIGAVNFKVSGSQTICRVYQNANFIGLCNLSRDKKELRVLKYFE